MLVILGVLCQDEDDEKFKELCKDKSAGELFRVKAVNDEGESEPLVADKAIKAKDPFG